MAAHVRGPRVQQGTQVADQSSVAVFHGAPVHPPSNFAAGSTAAAQGACAGDQSTVAVLGNSATDQVPGAALQPQHFWQPQQQSLGCAVLVQRVTHMEARVTAQRVLYRLAMHAMQPVIVDYPAFLSTWLDFGRRLLTWQNLAVSGRALAIHIIPHTMCVP